MKDEDVLVEARKRFKIAVDAESENRELALDDINFRHGIQWEERIKNQRRTEGRPCLTINKLEQRVDQVTGDQRMNRMGALIRPLDSTNSYTQMVEGANFTLAQIYQGIIKNIESVSNAKSAYDTGFDHAVGHGFGYWSIFTDYNDDDSFDQDIKIRRINNSMRVYLDPAAEEVTKIDAMWGFITSMVDKEDYPGSEWERGRGENVDIWYEGEKIRIAEYFRRVPMKAILWSTPQGVIKVKDDFMDIQDELKNKGVYPKKERTVDTYKVEWYKLGANEVFEKRDFPSKYIPIIPCYGKELNVNGRTIYRGVIRYAKDPQRIYNYTRTASVEQVALAPKAPWVIEETQIGNHSKLWEIANVKNHALLVYKNKPGVPPPQRQAPPQPSSGWLAESAISDQDIDASSGLYKASLGAPSNERSGKAINARKMEGDVGTFHFHDNRALSLEHTYKILVDMIPRVYDSDRMVRIKTPQDNEEMIQINQEIFDNGEWVKVYDLSQGKYDVSVDIGASYTTQRELASDSMREVLQYAPQLAATLLPIIAKNLDWPGAEDLVDALKEQQITPEQVQQAIEQALDNQKSQIDQFKAQTDRLKVTGDFHNAVDKLEVELLKIFEDSGVKSEELRMKAVEMVRQLGEPQQQ